MVCDEIANTSYHTLTDNNNQSLDSQNSDFIVNKHGRLQAGRRDAGSFFWTPLNRKKEKTMEKFMNTV